MKICIVAAGLATRLQPLTNYIPKFLINIGKQTGFVELIRYWKTYSDDFTIIIHPKYEELVRAYFDLYFDKETTLNIITIDTALGTAHTIETSLGNDHNGDDILFTWCDVIPSTTLDDPSAAFNNLYNAPVIFTVNNQKNRYKFVHNTLVKVDDATGDVFGIYYVPNFQNFYNEYAEGEDFADVLARKGNLSNYQVDSIIDFGDKEKLFEVLKNTDEGREFNSIEIGEKFVHKKALNEQGKKLIKREIAWYNEVHYEAELHKHVSVPMVYPSLNNDEMLMERVKGCAVFKVFPDMFLVERDIILDSLFKNLKNLHSITKKNIPLAQIVGDVKKEAYDKLLDRYSEIEHVIQSFGKNIRVVNGLPIDTIDPDPRRIIKSLRDELIGHYALSENNTYHLIHGDSQLSNTMVDNELLEVTLIDPRGYFGNTELYGLPDYDYAKVLYSLSGYDNFNYSQNFFIKNITETEIEFDIPNILGGGDLGTHLKHFKPVHYYWLAVIWLGLAQYIKNSPVKSLAAHYHGLYLATKFVNKDFTL